MDNTRNERIGSLISSALKMYMDESPRSVQASEGILGPSDIGFCRQKAALMTKGVAGRPRGVDSPCRQDGLAAGKPRYASQCRLSQQ